MNLNHQRIIRAAAVMLAALLGFQIAPEFILALVLGAVLWFVFLRPWSAAPVNSNTSTDASSDEWANQMFPSQDTPWANDLRRNGADTPGMAEHMNVTGNEDRDSASRW